MLHVDDESSFLEVATHFMEKVGDLEVHGATSVRSALDMISSSPFDVIVSDYQMPDIDGIEFLKMVRSKGSEIPFILFTGKGREDVVIEALNQGADYYLQKGGDLRSQFHELTSMISQAVQSRRYSAKLMESQERFRRLADSITDSLVGLDQDLRITFWNDAAKDLVGIDSEQAVGQNIADLVPQTRNTVLEELLKEARSSRTRSSSTVQVELETGPRTLDVSVYPAENGFLVFARDVTATRTTEQLLAESEQRYKSLVENSPEAIIVFSSDKVAYANPAALKIYGTDDETDLVGRSIYDMIPEESVAETAERIRTLYESDVPVLSRTMKVYTKSRQLLEMEVTSSPIVYSGKKAVQTILRDVTEKKNYMEALEKVNKKLNLLGSITRHDSLNQIGILNGWLTTAIERESDGSVRDMLLRAKDAADSLRKHMEFTGQYRSLGMERPDWMALAEVISQVTEGLGRQGISVTVDVGDTEVYADPMFEKVFRNLVNNSIAHGGDVRNISFSNEESGGQLVIVYRDDGVGIPVEDKERIFQRGYGRRHGHGLYLSREILSITGMTLKETGTQSKGAQFEISVPSGNYRPQNTRHVTP